MYIVMRSYNIVCGPCRNLKPPTHVKGEWCICEHEVVSETGDGNFTRVPMFSQLVELMLLGPRL